MSRLAKLHPDDLTTDQRRLYDELSAGPRGAGPQLFAMYDAEGRLEGPFNSMLLRPGLGERLQAVGSVLRYESALSARARELTILVVAAASDSEFERYAHEAVGRSVGLTDAEIAGLRRLDADVFTDPYEQLVAATAIAVAVRADLTDDEYAAARDGLADSVLYELLTLVGYYQLIALHLRVYRIVPPAAT